ncbi:hypothetical protein ACA910_021434 [Epithemia clementina (nom. ined.)]
MCYGEGRLFAVGFSLCSYVVILCYGSKVNAFSVQSSLKRHYRTTAATQPSVTVTFQGRHEPQPLWTAAAAKKQESEEEAKPTSTATNAVTRASWYAAEVLGKVVSGMRRQKALQQNDDDDDNSPYDLSQPPQSLKETLARLKQDNERNYFLSGEVDRLIYDPECTFADPFVSFQGRDRFVKNLANLGSFITKYSARPLNYEERLPSGVVETKFMVKLEVGGLPWKPVLAWPWGVTCEIDPQSYLIVRHTESWDIDAWEGVKQVFRKPTTTVG